MQASLTVDLGVTLRNINCGGIRIVSLANPVTTGYAITSSVRALI
jgi:hypothetical protein